MTTTELARRTVRSPAPSADRAGGRRVFILTCVLAVAGTAASIGGLVVHGLYTDDTQWAIAALRGGDLVTLVFVVPGLLLAMSLARRGSVRAGLVWGGLLAYGVYNYAFYVFGAAFDDLFLAHVVAFSTSIFALVAWVSDVDAPATAARFGPRAPRRSVAVLMLAIAAIFATLWTTFATVQAVTGHLALGAATLPGMHLVFALDLSLMVPSMAVGGIWLWRRTPWGYVSATALCVFGAVYQANLAAAVAFQFAAHVEGVKAVDPIGTVTLLALAWAAVAMLRRVR
jgi:hypothetical protein